MTYNEIKRAIENGDYDAYTDRVDVTIEISLFEYGILRNPITNECLFCTPVIDNWEMEDDKEIQLKSVDVTKEDVIDYLIEENRSAFFKFIGSDMNTELDRLDDNCFAHIIQSINSYDGWFNN